MNSNHYASMQIETLSFPYHIIVVQSQHI